MRIWNVQADASRFLVLVTLALTACGQQVAPTPALANVGGREAPPRVSETPLRITPQNILLSAGEPRDFHLNANTNDVVWSVNGSALPTRLNQIKFKAPSRPGTYTLTATVGGDPAATASTTVRVIAPLQAAPAPAYTLKPQNVGQFSGVATNASGDVYVTGQVLDDPVACAGNEPPFCEGGAYLAKYNAGGELLWSKRLGGEHASGSAGDVALDQNGNVYVLASLPKLTGDVGAGQGYSTLLKLSPAGEVLWIKQSAQETWLRLAVVQLESGAQGQLLLVGAPIPSVPSVQPLVLARYDTGGQQLWRKTLPDVHAGIGSLSFTFLGNTFAFKADAEGNSYFASKDVKTNDLRLDKFSADGAFLWTRHFKDEDRRAGDIGNNVSRMALDGQGGLYISWYSGNIQRDDFRAFIKKYDVDGHWLWNREIPLPSSPTEDAGPILRVDAPLAVSSGGSVYVATAIDSQGIDERLTTSVYLRRFNAGGQEVWAESNWRGAGSPTTASNLLLDQSGHLYLSGMVQEGRGKTGYLLRWNP